MIPRARRVGRRAFGLLPQGTRYVMAGQKLPDIVVHDAHVRTGLHHDGPVPIVDRRVGWDGVRKEPRGKGVIAFLDVVERRVARHLGVLPAGPRSAVVQIEGIANFARDKGRSAEHGRVEAVLRVHRRRSAGLVQLPLTDQASCRHHCRWDYRFRCPHLRSLHFLGRASRARERSNPARAQPFPSTYRRDPLSKSHRLPLPQCKCVR
jgi:hypothetical protein